MPYKRLVVSDIRNNCFGCAVPMLAVFDCIPILYRSKSEKEKKRKEEEEKKKLKKIMY